MKNSQHIKKVFYLLFLLTFSSVLGQNSNEYYFYYKGEKEFLELNTKYIYLSSENKEEILNAKVRTNRLTPVKEDKTYLTLKKVNGIKENNRIKFRREIKLKNLTKSEYKKEINIIKKRNQKIIVAPYFKSKRNEKIGLTNNFYVKLKNKEDLKLLVKQVKKHKLELTGYNEYMPLWFTISVTPDSENSLKMANKFYSLNLFEESEPEFIYDNLLNSNDPFYNDQWVLKNSGQLGGTSGIDMKIEQAWQEVTGSGIKVAVLDQGFEMNHPDLQGNTFGNGFDAETNTAPSKVRGNHGTPVAGIIGAIKDNNMGISGVAPNSQLISISVNFGFGTTYQMLGNGINWAWQNGADVISNSWGGGEPSGFFDDAINNALNNGRNGKGTIVVFASGNSNINGAEYPSNSNPLIVCVGAIDRCGVRSGRIDIVPDSCDPWQPNSKPGSSYGLPLDVVAGGSSVSSTDRQGVSGYNGYANLDYTNSFGGTSAACPYVSGVTALVLNANLDLTVQEVNDILEGSAQKIRTDLYNYSFNNGRVGSWNEQLGYGMVDAYQAVLLAQRYGCKENLSITEDVLWGNIDHQSAYKTITASNKVNVGSAAAYDAGISVSLKPGFEAKYGTHFKAYIEGCIPRNIYYKNQIVNKKVDYEFDCFEENKFKEDFSLNIFPNPTNNIINITLNNSYLLDSPDVIIYSMTKGLMYSNKFKKKEIKSFSIDMTKYPEGVYFVKILTKDKAFTEKIIKK